MSFPRRWYLCLVFGAVGAHLYLLALPPVEYIQLEFDVPAPNAVDSTPPGSSHADDATRVPDDLPGTIPGDTKRSPQDLPDDGKVGEGQRDSNADELLTGQALAIAVLRGHSMMPGFVTTGDVPRARHAQSVALWKRFIQTMSRRQERLGPAPWEGAVFHALGIRTEDSVVLSVAGRAAAIDASPAVTVQWYASRVGSTPTADDVLAARRLAQDYEHSHVAGISAVALRALDSPHKRTLDELPSAYFIDAHSAYLFTKGSVAELDILSERIDARLAARRDAAIAEIR